VSVPRWLVYTLLTLVVLSWIPLAMIARARTTTTTRPRVHLVPDMDAQPSSKPQEASAVFADGRAMRPPVAGTVARGQLRADRARELGREGEAWVTALPVAMDRGLLERGRERYEIFCAPCHGLSGHGDGMVAKRAEALAEGTWTPPSSFHTDLVRGRENGHLYNTITNGIRNMPGYGSQVGVHDRWAIVAYVRALQRSQNATLEDVPADVRASLR
jgi:mono/diheme cytochrome c family protein